MCLWCVVSQRLLVMTSKIQGPNAKTLPYPSAQTKCIHIIELVLIMTTSCQTSLDLDLNPYSQIRCCCKIVTQHRYERSVPFWCTSDSWQHCCVTCRYVTQFCSRKLQIRNDRPKKPLYCFNMSMIPNQVAC